MHIYIMKGRGCIADDDATIPSTLSNLDGNRLANDRREAFAQLVRHCSTADDGRPLLPVRLLAANVGFVDASTIPLSVVVVVAAADVISRALLPLPSKDV